MVTDDVQINAAFTGFNRLKTEMKVQPPAILQWKRLDRTLAWVRKAESKWKDLKFDVHRPFLPNVTELELFQSLLHRIIKLVNIIGRSNKNNNVSEY